MRSGLTNYSEALELNRALDETPARAWDPVELLRMGVELPPDFPPGTDYHYSNTNTVLEGLIIEQLEGKPIAAVFQERLFDPFGLEDTSFPAADDASMPEPYAHGYMFSTNVLTIGGSRLAPDERAAIHRGEILPTDHTNSNPSWTYAAGGAISTAGDLADWAEVLATGKALDQETQAERIASLQRTSDQPDAPRYGYNLAEMGPFLGHTGELPGYNSFMGYEPSTATTLIIWANLAPTPEGTDPATEMAKTLIGVLFGP